MKKQRRSYEAPAITMVSIEVQQPIAFSLALTLAAFDSGAGTQGIEDRTDGGSWGDGRWY